jgi:very-short-patch-repair endonuclease
VRHIHNLHVLSGRRKELRQNQTPAEEKLWWYLKDKRLGKKFRRQHSVDGYILDFYCKEKRLIVELDGEIHNSKDAQEYDRARDKFFIDLEYKVLRFKNSEVESNIEAVIKTIKANL